jgi:hypothetical protein
MSLEEKRIEYESFGMIRISRCSCNIGLNFHGSDVKHSSFLTLRISTSRIDRHLHKDRYHAKDKIVEVDLTHSQFSEMISNMNCGDGVPCTIKYANDKYMEKTPDRSKREEYVNEFSNDVDQLRNLLKEAMKEMDSLQSKNGATKADKSSVSAKIRKALQEVNCNMPFIKESFNKSLNRAVDDAKRNIEGHVMHMALSSTKRGLIDHIKHDKILEDSGNFIEMSGD